MYTQRKDLEPVHPRKMHQYQAFFHCQRGYQHSLRFFNPSLAYGHNLAPANGYLKEAFSLRCLRHGYFVSRDFFDRYSISSWRVIVLAYVVSCVWFRALKHWILWIKRTTSHPWLYGRMYNLASIGLIWNISDLFFCRVGEMASGLLVSSLPVLPRLFAYLKPRVTTAYNNLYPSRQHDPTIRHSERSRKRPLASLDGNPFLELEEQSKHRGQWTKISGNRSSSMNSVTDGIHQHPRGMLDSKNERGDTQIQLRVDIKQSSERRVWSDLSLCWINSSYELKHKIRNLTFSIILLYRGNKLFECPMNLARL